MNFLEQWLENVVLRRVCVKVVQIIISSWAAHQANIQMHMAHFGVTLTFVVNDPDKFALALHGIIYIAMDETRHWFVNNCPIIAKYL